MTEQNTPKITYDEMIDTLNGMVFGAFDRTTAKERESLDMAIKALKQYGALQEIRQEIENNMETIIGKYDASTPEHNRPSHKIERNNGRKECIDIIDKHIKEYEE